MNIKLLLQSFKDFYIRINSEEKIIYESVPSLLSTEGPWHICDWKQQMSHVFSLQQLDLLEQSFFTGKKSKSIQFKHQQQWYCVEYLQIEKEEYLHLYNSHQSVSKMEALISVNQLDPLTSVLHKNAIENYIQSTLAAGILEHAAVYMIDIDYFKNINDNYGHIFGDQIIIAVSNALRNICGESAKVGRIGGDEFLLFVERELDREGLKNVARLIRYALDNIKVEGANFSITATIGIAVYPENGTQFETLYQCCDKALYRGKQKGRDCHIIYHPQMHNKINTHLPNKTVQGTNELSIAQFFSKMVLKLKEMKDSSEVVVVYKEIANYFNFDRIVCSIHNKVQLCYELEDTYQSYTAYQELDFESYQSYFVVDNALVINDYRTWHLKDDAVFKVFEKAHMNSAIQILIYNAEQKFVGFLSYETIAARRVWQAAEINYTIILTNILCSYLRK